MAVCLGVEARTASVQRRCASCHMAGADTTDANASMLISSQEQLCGGCHANALKMSHRSGFTPPQGKVIPADYPLDWKGDLTCSTCHEVHSDLPARCVVCCWDASCVCRATTRRSLTRCAMAASHCSCPTLGNAQLAKLADSGSLLGPMYGMSLRQGRCTDRSQHDRAPWLAKPSGRRIMRQRSLMAVTSRHPCCRKRSSYRTHGECVSCHEAFTRNHGKVNTTGNITTLCLNATTYESEIPIQPRQAPHWCMWTKRFKRGCSWRWSPWRYCWWPPPCGYCMCKWERCG